MTAPDFDRIVALIMSEVEFLRARSYLLAALLAPPTPIDRRELHGLARRVRATDVHAPAPFGWCYERVPGYYGYLLMPLWLSWARTAHRTLRWGWYPTLIEWGFLQGPPSGWYHEHRFAWRWWESEYAIVHPRWAAFGRRLYASWRAANYGGGQ